jgi:hypothetical protein
MPRVLPPSLLLLLLLGPLPLRAQEFQHAIASLEVPKYPADFRHFA